MFLGLSFFWFGMDVVCIDTRGGGVVPARTHTGSSDEKGGGRGTKSVYLGTGSGFPRVHFFSLKTR